MTADLGVLIIHGMGDNNLDAMRTFKRALSKKLGSRASQIAVSLCHWESVTQEPQQRMWEKVRQHPDLDYRRLRRWLLGAFGDPVAYLAPKQGEHHPYVGIHQTIRACLSQLEAKLGAPDKPLLILAHSLGGTLITNYFWDNNTMHYARRRKLARTGQIVVGETPFEQMKTVHRLVTFGCNIPLFVSGYQTVACIRLPKNAQWLNLFDPDDMLGFPLEAVYDWPIDADGRERRYTDIQDHVIQVGGLLSSMTPMAHTAYWQDRDFMRHVVREIREAL